jgi:hypothetical protein
VVSGPAAPAKVRLPNAEGHGRIGCMALDALSLTAVACRSNCLPPVGTLQLKRINAMAGKPPFHEPTACAKRRTMTRTAAVERAFSLARSGQCRSVADIIRRLSDQDRAAVEAHLTAPSARRELILICSDAWLAAQ